MTPTRRDFIRTAGVAGVALASHDFISDLIAQSPKGQVLQSRFKGLADIVLGEAKLLGCSYADVRFTMNTNIPGAAANFAAGGGGGRGGGFPGGGGGGGLAVDVVAAGAVVAAASRATPTVRPAASACA